MYESEFIKNIKGKVAYLALLNSNIEVSGDGYERIPIIFNDILF